MADSRANTRNIQDDHVASLSVRKPGMLKKRQGFPRDTGANLRELPMAKAEIIEYQNKYRSAHYNLKNKTLAHPT